jgi:hypothetical protein
MPIQLLGLEVHLRRAVVGTAETGGRAGGEEHRLGQLRFAGATLADDRDTSQPPDFLDCHSVHLDETVS